MLIPVVRQYRQRRYLDAFVDQSARFVRRRLAVDRAVLDIAIMHLAGFIRKPLADIVGVFDDMVAQFLQLGAQFALLRHHQGCRGRCGRRDLGGSGCGRRSRAVATLLADDLRGHDGPLDLGRAAHRTVHQPALFLRLVDRRALKPAFERVVAFAAQGVTDHADPRTRCRCSGPALGSATLKRLPCSSDGTVFRAVSTLVGSIFAMKTPGSTPPSARISPQGAMISECPYVSRLFSCRPHWAAANTKQP